MKKKLAVCLVMVLLCLTGCSQAGEETTKPDPDTVFTTPRNPGSSLIEYDPDRQIYFSFHNSEYTIYMDDTWVPYFQFYILSKEPIDLNSVKVSIPIRTRYNIESKEEIDLNAGISTMTDLTRQEPEQNVFPYYLYLCYRGVDFGELARLKEEDPLDYESYKAEIDSYARDFYSLTPDELPQFHVYTINVQLDLQSEISESFSEVDIRVGDQVYHEEIGTVQLRKTIPLNITYDWDLNGENIDDGVCGYATEPTLYNDGIHKIENFYLIDVDQDKTLTNLRFLNPDIEFVDAVLRVNVGDGTYMEYSWNGEDPLNLYTGDLIAMDVIVRISGSDAIDQTVKAWGVLEYECESGTYHKLSESHMRRAVNFYELYAIVFDGLDVEDYYRCLYYPASVQESWRADYQE